MEHFFTTKVIICYFAIIFGVLLAAIIPLLEFKKHGIQTHQQNIAFNNKAKEQKAGA